MKKTMIYLPEEEHQRLKDWAELGGASMASLVREAVGEYISSRQRSKKDAILKIIGCATDLPPGNYSERVDEILDEWANDPETYKSFFNEG